jgi:hypothetical protein
MRQRSVGFPHQIAALASGLRHRGDSDADRDRALRPRVPLDERANSLGGNQAFAAAGDRQHDHHLFAPIAEFGDNLGARDGSLRPTTGYGNYSRQTGPLALGSLLSLLKSVPH